MKILTTAFLALVFWIGWIIASVQFGVANGINSFGVANSSVGTISHTGQQAVLAGTFIPAVVLTLAAVIMLVRLPFKARKKRRALG